MSAVMSPRIILSITGSTIHAPLPPTVAISGTTFPVWSATSSFAMGVYPTIEYRDYRYSRLVVVQRVNSAELGGSPALLSIAWVPVTVGGTTNSMFDMMSAQFQSDGLIHKSWDSVVALVNDSSPSAVAAKAAWPSDWNVSGSLFVGSVLA